ncbi:MAG: FecR domain-containing protein [Gammaproteobacteria bacterium]|nr:FecR domain-containing protein [Gammaproteobacteria bacterium]
MVRLLKFTSRGRIAAEASDWLGRLDRGLSPEERTEFQAWLASDPRCKRMLEDMAVLWDDMEALRELSALMPLPSARPGRRLWPLGLGAALAGALVSVAVGVLWVTPGGPSLPGRVSVDQVAVSPASAGRLATVIGAQLTETLADGSVVQLNTYSEIELAFSDAERRVTVHRGEVHFDVRPDAQRKFVVIAGERSIEAVGTAFNVRVRGVQEVEVLVTEGRVLISPQSRQEPAQASGRAVQQSAPVRLAAGEMISLTPITHQVRQVSAQERSNRLAWQLGMLVFDGESLEDALAEISRYTDVRFDLVDSELRQIRIGGLFKAGDLAGLISSLEQNFGVGVQHDDSRGVVRLYSQNPGR